MNDNSRSPWYAVITKPSRESFAKERLDEQGYLTWLPQCRDLDKDGNPVERVLISRVLFLQSDPTQELAPIDNTPGVSRLLKWRDGRPQKVWLKDIDDLKQRESEGGVINVIPEPEHLKYESGQELVVVGTPFDGHHVYFNRLTRKGTLKLYLDRGTGLELELTPAQVRCA